MRGGRASLRVHAPDTSIDLRLVRELVKRQVLCCVTTVVREQTGVSVMRVDLRSVTALAYTRFRHRRVFTTRGDGGVQSDYPLLA